MIAQGGWRQRHPHGCPPEAPPGAGASGGTGGPARPSVLGNGWALEARETGCSARHVIRAGREVGQTSYRSQRGRLLVEVQPKKDTSSRLRPFAGNVGYVPVFSIAADPLTGGREGLPCSALNLTTSCSLHLG